MDPAGAPQSHGRSDAIVLRRDATVPTDLDQIAPGDLLISMAHVRTPK